MRSVIHIPDSLLERQYYLEMYKFACVARSNAPPISLQAVWTADNGKLPPWKGDFHHDLNTELSYWPGYNANHTDLTAGYTNWLWAIREENKKWTRQYFQTAGLNVPGVTTITGKPMGGWIQYSMSPTTGAWLAQHVYWQWKYTADKRFLKKIAYPWFREVQQYLSAILQKDEQGHFQLPLSSSPEYHDNSPQAWFRKTSNYDLALLKSFYKEWQEVELAATGRQDSQALAIEQGLPDWDVDSTGLTIAPGQDLDQSHRHHAQLMAIYPMQLLNARDSLDRVLINRSLKHLEHIGTRAWCGYSFSWAACIYARALQGEKAAEQLRIFARNFCSPYSFHLNGDQSGGRYSSFTYRPFTLEGNFAFAQGIHELLLQEQDDCIYIFPALPSQWKNVSFTNLLCQGGFLLSANREQGIYKSVTVKAQYAGWLRLQLPFASWQTEDEERSSIKVSDPGKIEVYLHKGQSITFTNAIE
jgi:alpha-L-fucosidase 2